MSKKKFDINQLYYIKTIICAFVRSAFYYIIRAFRNFLQTAINFIKLHKQTSVKLLVPIVIICVAYYACSASKREIKQNIQDMFDISDEIRTHYTDKPDYWGLSAKEVIDNKLLSDRFLRKGTIVLSSGMTVSIGSGINADAVMPFSKTFDIVLAGLNKAQCISYAEANLKDEDLLKISSIHIFNNSGEFIFEWGGDRKLPISRYATKDICTDTDNTLVWSIK